MTSTPRCSFSRRLQTVPPRCCKSPGFRCLCAGSLRSLGSESRSYRRCRPPARTGHPQPYIHLARQGKQRGPRPERTMYRAHSFLFHDRLQVCASGCIEVRGPALKLLRPNYNNVKIKERPVAVERCVDNVCVCKRKVNRDDPELLTHLTKDSNLGSRATLRGQIPLVQEVLPVQRIPLRRPESRVADDAA